MNVTVIGGTGLIGRKLVRRLREHGHVATVAARSTGVNMVTGEGLVDALRGADVVVDVSNSSYADAGDMHDFFKASGARLLAAESFADIGHHVVLSAVGTDRLGASGYFRAKRVQEEMVAGAAIPFTIVRSTPFFEFIYHIVDAGGDGNWIHLPPVLMQPIAAEDVAAALLRVVVEGSSNSVVEIAGPDVYRLSDIAEDILVANEDPRTIVIAADAPYFGAQMGDEPLTGCDWSRLSAIRFEDWLRRSLEVA